MLGALRPDIALFRSGGHVVRCVLWIEDSSRGAIIYQTQSELATLTLFLLWALAIDLVLPLNKNLLRSKLFPSGLIIIIQL